MVKNKQKRKNRYSYPSSKSSTSSESPADKKKKQEGVAEGNEVEEEDEVFNVLDMAAQMSSDMKIILVKLEKLDNIEDTLKDIVGKIELFETKLINLDKRVKIVEEKQEVFEKVTSELDERYNDRITELHQCLSDISEATRKVEYLEAYSRRENLIFTGIPLKDHEDTLEVLRQFLKDKMKMEKADNIEFQRVHRTGRRKGDTRPIIARFLRYPDVEEVLRNGYQLKEWMDITPYEIGMQKYGIYIEPERFCDKYFCGVRVRSCPEPPLHFIQGFCGSAFTILLNRVLHHPQDPEKVIKEATREERDDGRKRMEEIKNSSHLDHVEDEASDDEQDNKSKATAANGKQVTSDNQAANGDEEEVDDESTWDKITNFVVNNISFLKTREGRAAKIYNFLRGLDLVFNPKDFDKDEIKVKQLTTDSSTKGIFVCDAGLVFNSPYPIALRQERKVDLILSFDYSAREKDVCQPFDELIKAEIWAKENKLPFPPINYKEQYKKYGLREYYVFKDQNDPTCPVVIHFPLVNNKFKEFKAPGVRRKGPEEKAEGAMPIFDDPEAPYSTFNFHYPNKPYDRLVNLCNFNVKVCEKVIFDVIAECVERKKKSNR